MSNKLISLETANTEEITKMLTDVLKDADTYSQIVIIWEAKDGTIDYVCRSKSMLSLTGLLSWIQSACYANAKGEEW